MNHRAKTNSEEQKTEKKISMVYQSVKMKRSINLLHCTAILVAITGHTAIFISPNAILQNAGSMGMALIVWFIGGVINLSLALCFTELGTMMPHAGGPYAYVMMTFGSLPGFLIMWGYIVLIAGPFWAFESYIAALYAVKPLFVDCNSSQVESAVTVLASWLLVTMVVINCTNMKYITKIQTLLSSTKILALSIIIAGGIAMMVQGRTENFEKLFEGTSKEPSQIALSVFFSIFSYGGWQVLLSMMEEVKNPGKDLPRSIYITFAILIVKYIMVNVAYFTLMTSAEMLSSNALAMLFTHRLYRPLTILMSVLVALITIGALNAAILGHSRLLFAGARKGHMVMVMSMIHPKYLTPGPSIVTVGVWSLVMLYSSSVETMMEFIGLFATITNITVICALLYLRWTKPREDRPYKVILIVPIMQLIVNTAVLLMSIYQKPINMAIGLGILFIGVPVYYIGVTWKNKPKALVSFIEQATIVIQKLSGVVKTS